LGKLEPGFQADFTILDTDILAVDNPESILDARTVMTVIDGEIRYVA
jgi:predicted amidohydrolase YtcJ